MHRSMFIVACLFAATVVSAQAPAPNPRDVKLVGDRFKPRRWGCGGRGAEIGFDRRLEGGGGVDQRRPASRGRLTYKANQNAQWRR